jgi:hypothetical protein
VSAAPTPTWRWLVVGLLFAGLALYLLVNGEIGVDKQRTMLITRVANPLLYWLSVVVSGVLGALALRKAWLRLRS